MAAAHLKVFVDLGEEFLPKLKRAMEEELEVASRKWDYYPTEDEIVQIYEHAYSQVRNRIQSVANNPWKQTQIIAFSMPGPKIEMSIPSEESDRSSLKLIRARDGWIIDQDESEIAVPLSAFPSVFTEAVLAWARTAVFYSVGSYKS